MSSFSGITLYEKLEKSKSVAKKVTHSLDIINITFLYLHSGFIIMWMLSSNKKHQSHANPKPLWSLILHFRKGRENSYGKNTLNSLVQKLIKLLIYRSVWQMSYLING